MTHKPKPPKCPLCDVEMFPQKGGYVCPICGWVKVVDSGDHVDKKLEKETAK